jgi:hypothetical protein
LGRAVEDLGKRFEKEGFKLYMRTGLVKPMTQALDSPEEDRTKI